MPRVSCGTCGRACFAYVASTSTTTRPFARSHVNVGWLTLAGFLYTRAQRQGGVGHADLFSRSHVGTKYVVEEYIDQVRVMHRLNHDTAHDTLLHTTARFRVQVCKSLRFVLYTPLVPYSPAELRGVRTHCLSSWIAVFDSGFSLGWSTI